MSTRETRLFYSVLHGQGAEMLELHVLECSARSLVECIDGCRDNKAGYNNQAEADRIGGQFTDLLERGYTHRMDVELGGHPSFHLIWPKHAGEFLRPRLTIGEDYRRAHKNLRLADRVHAAMHRGRVAQARNCGWAFKTPDDTIAALGRMGAIQFEVVGYDCVYTQEAA